MMKKKMKKLKKSNGIALCLCFLLWCVPYAGTALSIEEMPAEKLIDGATHVVLAEVLQSQRLDPEPDPEFPSVVHTIRIVHSYKGDLTKGDTFNVVQNMGSDRAAESQRLAVIFINPSRAYPDQLVVFNTMQGLFQVAESGYFMGFGPVDIHTLDELEEILQAKGYNVEREAPKETDDTSGHVNGAVNEADDAGIRILINGVKLEIPQGEPGAFLNDDNRTLIPVRFVTEGLGAAILWDEVTRAVDIRLGENEIRLVVGESEAIVNGQVVAFDTSTVIIQGRTFVPLRFISEALGASVNWEGPSQTVVIRLENETRSQ